MKPIIIFMRTVTDLPTNIGKIIQKKNKTILKDFKSAQNILANYDPSEYQYNLEDWEVVTPDYIQTVIAPSGDKIRPVHIVVDMMPKFGFKALFQTSNMVTFKFGQGEYTLKSGFVQKNGLLRFKILAQGKVNTIEEILAVVDQKYHPAIIQTINSWNECLDAYKYPIWAKTDDRKY